MYPMTINDGSKQQVRWWGKLPSVAQVCYHRGGFCDTPQDAVESNRPETVAPRQFLLLSTASLFGGV